MAVDTEARPVRRDAHGRRLRPLKEENGPPQASPAEAASKTRAPSIVVEPTERARTSIPGRVLNAAILVLLLAGVTQVAWTLMNRPDPHFVKASRSVENYEKGRAPGARNYSNAIYSEALAELALVDPDSVSAAAAAILQRELLAHRKLFEENQGQREREQAEARSLQEHTRSNVREGLIRGRLNPTVEFPECEDESKSR